MPQQDPGPDGEDQDGPGRGVARISLMNGEVSVKRGDTGEVMAAAINAPLMVSDHVMTGPGSRAELQFDSMNLLRLSEVAEVRMTELEWQRYMIQIAAGTVTFRVIRDGSQAQIELNTPSVAIRPLKKGEYRITVHEDGSTEITVRSGELEIFTQRGSERLKSGRTMLARGTAEDPEVRIVSAPARDDFDRWNQDRDRYFERSQAYDNMSADIYGGEDLDANGNWVNYPQYGRVWVPRVNAGWAPYQSGRWVYYDWYGWTWVSNDSWGWAPYHYGRWFYDASIGWGWWPGRGMGIGRRHYWRPAFVSFFGWGGGGGGVQIGFGFGNVGWVPLAPYEPCYGWWGRNRYNGWRNNGFQNNTRIVNNINITNVYRNARVPNGFTSVGAGDFGRRGVNEGNRIRARAEDLRSAGVVRGNLPVAPERGSSTRLSDRDPRTSGFARTREDARAFRTREPARIDRVPFEDQRRGTQELARRSFDRTGGNNEDGGARGNTPRDTGGWRRAVDNRGANVPANRQPGGANDGENNGWRRFGDTQRTGNRGDGNRSPATPADPNAGGAGRRDPALRSNDPGQPSRTRQGGAEDGWRRFGGSSPRDNSGRDNSGGANRVRPQASPDPASGGGENPSRGSFGRRADTPRVEPRTEQPQRQMRSPEPVRISPPIVRERSAERPSAPRVERSNPGGGGDSGGRRGGGGGGGGGGGSRERGDGGGRRNK
jgi:hypothetical protein